MATRNKPLTEDTNLDIKIDEDTATDVPEESPPWHTLKYVKVFFLSGVWFLSTYYMMKSSEDNDHERLIALPPNIDYQFPLKKNNKDLYGVAIEAPFDKFHSYNSSKPSIIIQAKRYYFEYNHTVREMKNLSDEWNLNLVPQEQRDHAELIYKKKILEFEPDPDKIDIRCEEFLQIRSTNMVEGTTLHIRLDDNPIDRKLGITCAIIVLIFLYVLIIWEIINQSFAAILASTLALGILAGIHERPSLMTIMGWIDVETFLLLFSMMILVAVLTETGIFDYSAVVAFRVSKGKVWPLIATLCFTAECMSALLDNVTLMLLCTPVVIRLCEVKSLDPVPLLICMIMFSNVGGVGTPVGDPPNVIISTNAYIAARDVNFFTFTMHMIPVLLIASIQTYIQLRFIYRAYGKSPPNLIQDAAELLHDIKMWAQAAKRINPISFEENLVSKAMANRAGDLKKKLDSGQSLLRSQEAKNFENTLKELKEQYPIRNKVLLVKSTIVFIFVISLFFLHSIPHFHHLSLGWASLLGALLLLIIADKRDMEALLVRVEWSTLLFFASLIMLMEALTELGLIATIGELVIKAILIVRPEHQMAFGLFIILWVTALASAFLNNIPVATMMVKIIIVLSEDSQLDIPVQPMVWAVVMGACFGGNGTLIGASANVVASGIAEQHGYKFNFMTFFRVGFAVMLGNLIIATCYLMISHIVFQWH
ncbi:P protein-like [Teleopsis dalmanni]|uniref:P protein-like n=1 Tax=Teleopsis dalmanni TaxID=139649 RepID=UPI0018CD45F7|nr:P protein-like [Teleopsis dalmanni]